MENIIDDTLNFINNLFENDFSGHDYYHSIRVYKMARKIAEIENADIETVSIAALLHDVDDWKLSPETCLNNTNAVNYLRSKNYSESKIKQICSIINEVSYKGTDSVMPSTIEGKCVQDADRLDALGAIGIARTFAYGGSHKRQMYDPDILPVLNMNESLYKNHVSTSVNHFYEKLFLLKDMMNTDTGKRIAVIRDQFMKKYIEEFLSEWDGDDI